jgi:hypothetical protein
MAKVELDIVFAPRNGGNSGGGSYKLKINHSYAGLAFGKRKFQKRKIER